MIDRVNFLHSITGSNRSVDLIKQTLLLLMRDLVDGIGTKIRENHDSVFIPDLSSSPTTG